MKWSEYEMQTAITRDSNLFSFRRYAVVPNVSWGLSGLNYEVDLLALSKDNVFHEVEIKISKADLIADKKKVHKHYCKFIQRLWFAIPGDDYNLDSCGVYTSTGKGPIDKHFALANIPEYAGLVVVRRINYRNGLGYKTDIVRRPRPKRRQGLFKKPESKTVEKFLRLGVLRMWTNRG